MKKLTVNLGQITKGMRLKFSLILDNQIPQQKRLNLVNTYKFNGNEYITLNPHPFITIDISDTFTKTEEWNSNRTVTLNLMSKMVLESMLSTMITNFKIKDLFYYQNNDLRVNQELAKKLEKVFVIGNKTCVLRYAVIQDDKTQDGPYEGVIFMINKAENFCYLTFDEIQFLFYTLRSINLYDLCFNVLNYYQTLDIKDDDYDIDENLLLEEVEKLPPPNRVPKTEPPNTIPDLE